jgi:hypothetical protein
MFAVDKCIAKRDYLRFISLEEYLPDQIAEKLELKLDFSIEYDLEWLAILKTTDFLFYEGMGSAGPKFGVKTTIERGQKNNQIFAYEFVK